MNIQENSQLILVGPVLNKPLNPIILKFYQLDTIPQIAVDGGVRFAVNPALWIGDGDSGKPDQVPAIHKESQNLTDLSFTLEHLHSWKWKTLHLFGFLGKRRDHEWANLGEVCQELQKRDSSTAIFYGEESKPRVHLFPKGKHTLKVNGYFSLLSFEKATVTIEGECEYKMQKQSILPFSGRGVSNRGNGEVQVECSASIMVILLGEIGELNS